MAFDVQLRDPGPAFNGVLSGGSELEVTTPDPPVASGSAVSPALALSVSAGHASAVGVSGNPSLVCDVLPPPALGAGTVVSPGLQPVLTPDAPLAVALTVPPAAESVALTQVATSTAYAITPVSELAAVAHAALSTGLVVDPTLDNSTVTVPTVYGVGSALPPTARVQEAARELPTTSTASRHAHTRSVSVNSVNTAEVVTSPSSLSASDRSRYTVSSVVATVFTSGAV